MKITNKIILKNDTLCNNINTANKFLDMLLRDIYECGTEDLLLYDFEISIVLKNTENFENSVEISYNENNEHLHLIFQNISEGGLQ